MPRAVLIAFLAGALVGYAISFVTRSAPEVTTGPATTLRHESSPIPIRGNPPALRGAHEPGGRDDAHASIIAAFEAGDFEIVDEEPPVEATIARARRAQVAGKFGAFLSAVGSLGRADTVEGDRYLLSVLQDETVQLPPSMVVEFQRALMDSEVEGLAAAARGRFDAALASGFRSVATLGLWLDLTAANGDVDDLRWILDSSRGERDLRERARESIQHVRDPETLDFMLAWYRSPTQSVFVPKVGLLALARHRPEEAMDLAMVSIRRWDQKERGGPPLVIDDRFAMDALAQLPEERADDVKRILRSLESPEAQLYSLRIVGKLAERGIDIGDLSHLVQLPLRLLREHAEDPTRHPDSLVSQIGWAVMMCRATWSPAVVAALRAYKGTNSKLAAQFAHEIEAKLKSPWK